MNDPAPSVGVDDVIITGELTRRPSRTPDFEAESKPLTSLVKELAERPGNVLQRLVEVIVEMGVAGSAGVSLLEGERFRWAAIAGEWAALVDEGMPVDASPCGIVVARDQMLLFEHPEQVFPGNQIDPLITETLLVPFHVGGKAVGTVWLLSHDARKFDAEDARLLQSLAEFASAAYQLNSAIAENQTYLSEERSAARRLQQVSKELLLSDEPQPLYDLILDVMTGIMRSQAASIQILDEKTGQLRLLGSRGLHPRSAEHWQIVDAQSPSGCGEALRSGSRVIIADVEKHPPFAGDPVLEEYRRCGLRSVQSTSLIARDGRCLGMISTLWAEPHTPSEDDFLRLDVLAREAADLIERRAFEEALRDGEEQLRLIVEGARDYAIFTTDRNGIIDTWLAGAESVFGYPPDEALGQPADILFTLEDRERGAPQQELETARREDKSPDVRWHLHKDGHRVFIEGEVVSLRDGAQGVRGFLKIGRDATKRRLAEEGLRQSEERLRQFGDASSDILWMREPETMRWTYLTPAFDEIYGLSREEALAGDNFANWVELILPEDRPAALDNIAHVRRGESARFEYRIRRPVDGSVRWLRDTDFPILDEHGHVIMFGGIGQDITALKMADHHQRTLLTELQHRVRNTLAVVRSIARRTAENSTSVQEMLAHFQGRLDAFSRVQAALTRSTEVKVSLASLVGDEMTAHAARDGEQVRISGPDIDLEPRTAERMSLAIHELTTNAVKHGALSNQEGRISVDWSRHDGGDGEHLVLRWRESGIHIASSEVEREGFGMELLRRSLPYELEAETRIALNPTGLEFDLKMPLRAPAREP
jgi:PAS domain S-box-containing protein